MTKTLKYSLLCILFGLLIAVRAFESELFYDPYLEFFRNDYLYLDSPETEIAKLLAFIALRYCLNTFISLGILYLVFNDVNILKFSVFLYIIAFIILIVIYSYFVIYSKQEDYYLFFNVRRLLIHPIILLLLLPAFYYHKLKQKQ